MVMAIVFAEMQTGFFAIRAKKGLWVTAPWREVWRVPVE